MAGLRNRISISLTDAEFAEIQSLADLLGIKPTRCVYEAVKLGVPQLVKSYNATAQSVNALKWNLNNLK